MSWRYGTCLLLIVGVVNHARAADTTTTNTVTDTSTAPASTATSAPPTPPPPPPNTPYDFSSALTRLQGEYTVKPRTHSSYRPTWASIWPINDGEEQFSIYFWPPKYCHAIYLCPVLGQVYDGNKKFKEFECDKSYIKYYPHINKLLFKGSESDAEVEKVLMSNSLKFRREAGATYNIFTLNEKQNSYSDWKTAVKTELKWDLKEDPPAPTPSNQSPRSSGLPKHLLILTNSRMCEVNKPGSSFHPIFDQEFDNTTRPKLAQWLTNPTSNSFMPTDFLPPVGGSEKTIDLLPQLKTFEHEGATLGMIKSKCSAFEKISVTGSRKPVFESSSHVSIVSYNVVDLPDTFIGGYDIKLEFTLSNCQWIRFWRTSEDIKDYNTKMKPSETLDLFINHGFFLAPDSNKAVPLPDNLVMTKVKLAVHRDSNTTNSMTKYELNEVAFGGFSTSYLFRQYFKSKEFAINSKLHIIRAPHCETNIIVNKAYHGERGTFQQSNKRIVKQCKYSYLKDPFRKSANPSS